MEVSIKKKREKIETRSDYFQLFSCFNSPPPPDRHSLKTIPSSFSPTLPILFRFIDRVIPSSEREKARDSNSSTRENCFSRIGRKRRRKKLSGTQS